MAEFAVKVPFRAKDGVTKSFRDMDRGAARFGRTAKKSFRDASSSASRFRDVTKAILGAGAIQRALSGVTAGVRALTTQFIDFDQSTIGATSRFKDIGPTAKNFDQALKSIRDRAREAGATTEFTAAQAADSLDFLARAGWKSAEAFAGLDSMINLATATGEDFARVADISSDLMGSFGLNTDNTAQKIKNLNRLNNVLVKTVNSTNVNMENLFDTMTQVGQIGGGVLGASLEDVAALTGALGNAGIKGSNAMTALKNAYLRLAAPTGEGADLLEFFKITLDDGAGGAKRMTDVMEELGNKIKGLSLTDQATALNAIFGKRAIAGAKNIIDNIASINKLRKTLENVGDEAAATAARMRKSLGNRLKALGSAASEFGFKIIEAFEVQGEGAINKLTEAIRKFDPTPIIIGIGTAVDIIKTLWSVLRPFVPFMPWFIGMWIAFGAVTKILALASMISNFLLFWGAIMKVSGAMGILNAVIAANPVAAIIIGVTALIALLIVFRKEILGIGKVIVAALLLPLMAVLKLVGMIPGFSRAAQAGNELAEFQKELVASGIKDISGERTAPNQDEADARQGVDVGVNVNFNNAPEGTTAEPSRGSPAILFDALGA